MLFPEGLKSKNALPEGVQVSSRGVNYTDFLAFQRGKSPKGEVLDRGGLVFKCNSPISFLLIQFGSSD